MAYWWAYHTPEGFSDMVMASDGEALNELYFTVPGGVDELCGCEERLLPVFRETCRWLDLYFSGRRPDFTPPYRIKGLTPFRQDVQEAMLAIPYGGITTYGEIANRIAEKRGVGRMSAQAVGGAVGWNPICIIVPCHRVVGANRRLTGYGGGIQNKIALLALEGHDMRRFAV